MASASSVGGARLSGQAFPVRRLELATDVAIGRQRQPLSSLGPTTGATKELVSEQDLAERLPWASG